MNVLFEFGWEFDIVFEGFVGGYVLDFKCKVFVNFKMIERGIVVVVFEFLKWKVVSWEY